MNKLILLSAPLCLVLPACADMGGADLMADTETATSSSGAMNYLAMAGSSDMYEIESSRLALSKGSSAEVKTFAQMMVDHHTKTTQQAMASARSAGLNPPPPALLPPQQKMLTQLQPLAAGELDRAYLQQQMKAHEMALALHRNYAESGDNAQLRQTAQTTVPIIEQHIAQLRAMPSAGQQ